MNRKPLRRRIAKRAGLRCEYCKLHEATQLAVFRLDHIIPRKHRGTNELSNRCYLCVDCNLRKTDLVRIPVPNSTRHLPIFNPRTEEWNDHFDWVGFRLRGKTELGTAMMAYFGLNSAKRIRIRKLEASLGLHPPPIS